MGRITEWDMSVDVAFKILGIVDLAVELWRANGGDEEDLFALRDQLAEKSKEEKVAILRERGERLQARADALRNQ